MLFTHQRLANVADPARWRRAKFCTRLLAITDTPKPTAAIIVINMLLATKNDRSNRFAALRGVAGTDERNTGIKHTENHNAENHIADHMVCAREQQERTGVQSQ